MTPVAITVNPVLKVNEATKQISLYDESNVPSQAAYNTSEIETKILGVITGVLEETIANRNTNLNPLVVNCNEESEESVGFAMTLDDNGNLVNGTYKLQYRIGFVANAVDAIASLSNSGPNGVIVIENRDWRQVLEPGDQITITEAATAGNNGTKTIHTVSYSAPNTFIHTTTTFAGTVPESSSPAKISFTKTQPSLSEKEFEYVCQPFSICAKTSVNCYSTRYGQLKIQDKTSIPAGHTVLSKSISLAYPAALTNPVPDPNPVTSNTGNLVLNQIATGEFVYTITRVLEYIQSDGLIVHYTLTFKDKLVVNCLNECSIRNCYDKIVAATKNNPNPVYANIVSKLGMYLHGANMANACGDHKKYEEYMNSIEAIIEQSGLCNEGCGCGGNQDAPQWIDNMANDPNGSIQTMLEQLETQVGLLEQAVNNYQDDGTALAQYTNYLNTIQSILAAWNAEQSDVFAIHALVQGLNPNSGTFANELASIVALFPNVDFTSILDDAIEMLSVLQNFNTDYPFNAELTIAPINTITSLITGIGQANSAWLNYSNAVASLTPSNYISDILNIYSLIQVLQTELTEQEQSILTLITESSSYQTAIEIINEQLADISSIVASLQANQTITSKIQPLFCDVNTSGLATTSKFAILRDKTLRKGSYCGIKITGHGGTSLATLNLNIVETSYTLQSIPVAGKRFELNLVLIPDLTISPIPDFKLGGNLELNDAIDFINVVGISGITEVPYDTFCNLEITSNEDAVVLDSIEITEFDLTWN